MTRNVKCPYCSGRMLLRELGMSQNKVYFYECIKCLSRSPMSWNKVAANSMAKMRNEEKKAV